MSKPRVLITGGAGFLGSHLCDRFLADGYEVICMDNLITGDLRNVEHLFAEPQQALFGQLFVGDLLRVDRGHDAGHLGPQLWIVPHVLDVSRRLQLLEELAGDAAQRLFFDLLGQVIPVRPRALAVLEAPERVRLPRGIDRIRHRSTPSGQIMPGGYPFSRSPAAASRSRMIALDTSWCTPTMASMSMGYEIGVTPLQVEIDRATAILGGTGTATR